MKGPKYKEFQVSEMANSLELQLPTPTVANGYTIAKQLDGALVIDALPYAACFPISQRIQGIVLIWLLATDNAFAQVSFHQDKYSLLYRWDDHQF